MIRKKTVILFFILFFVINTGNISGQNLSLYKFIDSINSIVIISKNIYDKGTGYLNMMKEKVECSQAIEIFDRVIPLYDSAYKYLLQIDTIFKINKCQNIVVNDSAIHGKYGKKSTGEMEVDYLILLDDIERSNKKFNIVSQNLKSLYQASQSQSAWRVNCNPYNLKQDDTLTINFINDDYMALFESIEVYMEKIKNCND